MKKASIFLTIGLILALGSAIASAEEINIVGTGAGMILLETLGKAFTRINPDIIVSVPKSIGSGGGIKAVGKDQADIGRISREIKDNEKEYNLTYVPFAKIPIVFVVHRGVGIKNLSPQQICDIYAGRITNWKLVGGKDSDIRVVRREEGDSSLEVLMKSFPGFKDITITPKSKIALNDQENCDTIQNREGTIGFGTYDNMKKNDVITLTIDGKSPASVAYPYFGTLALIFKEKNKSGSIAKFVDFVTSKAGREIIKEAGGLPY